MICKYCDMEIDYYKKGFPYIELIYAKASDQRATLVTFHASCWEKFSTKQYSPRDDRHSPNSTNYLCIVCGKNGHKIYGAIAERIEWRNKTTAAISFCRSCWDYVSHNSLNL